MSALMTFRNQPPGPAEIATAARYNRFYVKCGNYYVDTRYLRSCMWCAEATTPGPYIFARPAYPAFVAFGDADGVPENHHPDLYVYCRRCADLAQCWDPFYMSWDAIGAVVQLVGVLDIVFDVNNPPA